MKTDMTKAQISQVTIPMGNADLKGELIVPADAAGLVIFAHGSGSGRLSPRNQSVARALQEDGLGTLLFDLLTEQEERSDERTGHLRFDIPLLAERLAGATKWAGTQEHLRRLAIGYFGASTGAAAALVAAAKLGEKINAVVSRGGRPDLAGNVLPQVKSPTLLIVGSNDSPVVEMNESASELLRCEKALVIVPGASHLFEEPGALARVSRLASDWFRKHFSRGAS